MRERLLLLLILVLPACRAQQPALLTSRPYLQAATATSVVVVWRTAEPERGLVRYGPSPLELTSEAREAGPVRQHEVRLEGLAPGTRYYYAVGAGELLTLGGDADHFFETAPPPAAGRPLSAWILGDSGTGRAQQRAVRDAFLAHVGANRPDLFLHVGDVAYWDGTPREFQEHFFQPYGGLLSHLPFWPALGNHEGRRSSGLTGTGPYFDYFVLPRDGAAGGVPSGTEAYYAFDWGDVHFVSLDTSHALLEPGAPMLAWLAADLAATGQRWIVAFFHHPPYSKGTHDSDREARLVAVREHLVPVLEAGGADLVLAGHSHNYERTFLVGGGRVLQSGSGRLLEGEPFRKAPGDRGAVYVVTGHGGARLGGPGGHPLVFFREEAFGSTLLHVDRGVLTLRNLRLDGEVTDSFTLVKGPALVVGAPAAGAHLEPGGEVEILWRTVGASVPAVRLELSVDDGRSYQTLAESVPDTGRWTWKVPDQPTLAARIRVSAPSSPSLTDVSDAPFTIARPVARQVVSFGDRWRYHAKEAAPPSDWWHVDFDDQGWPEGPAQLGYGEGDEATVIEGESPARSSVYFRRVVELHGVVTGARLRALHDDGIVVWVNGHRLFERHVGVGAEHEASLPGWPFVPGPNAIAVMVEQAGPDSADLSFDLSLTVEVDALGDALPGTEPAPEEQGACGGCTSVGLPSGLLLTLLARRALTA